MATVSTVLWSLTVTNSSHHYNSDLRGVKSANTTKDLFNPYRDMVTDLMMTSFWLPTDAITDKDWVVNPVMVVTGTQFHKLMVSSRAGEFANIHTDVDEDLVAAAHYVGISIRSRVVDNAHFLVAKVWYGVPKKVDDLKLGDV